MANLIEQMNVLKGLDDQTLQAELNSPSGTAPPFMVLSEVQRRKDMRQRYEGEVARRQKRTTVAEDLGMPSMVGGMPPAVMPPGAPAASGIAAAQQPMVEGFADGGIIDYADIARKYNDRLAGMDEAKDRARALALLQAGAAIMGGGSSNTLRNIGAGAQTGIASYADQLKTIDSEELNLMRGLTDIGQLQQALANSDADRALRREEIGISRDRLNTDRKPASVLEYEYYKDLDEAGKQEYERLNPAFNPNAVTDAERLADDLDKIYADTQKLFPINEYDTAEIAAEKQRKAQAAAYQRIAASRGKLVADEWARNQGLAVGDIIVGGAPDAALNDKDPLGLGL